MGGYAAGYGMNIMDTPPRPARQARLLAFLGLEGGEARPVAGLAGLNFAVSSAFVLVQTSAFGLFIEAFGSHALPYAYFSVALLSSLVAYLYLQLSQRVSFASSLYINLTFLAAVSLVFWLGLRSGLSRWFIFLLPFWFQTLVNLANLVVWHLAGHTFHVRQAKRVFGLIVGGNWIANIVGGVLVASLLGTSSPADLYLLAAIAIALSMLVLRSALTSYRELPGSVPASVSSEPARQAAARAALSHPYARLIFAYTLLWWLAFFVLENIFFHQVEGELASSAALASFLGWQLAVMGVVALFTTSVLTSRLARRFGLRLGLLVMPAVVTAAILLIAVGGSLGWSNQFLFWAATIARTLNIALGFSLSQAMGSLLFQPLQGKLRAAAQTIAEGIVQPLAIGVAGLILLVFNTTLGLDAVGLAYVFLVVTIPWFWSIFALTRSYPLVMSEALKKRALGESTTLLFDSSAMDLLRRALNQPQPGQALYALHQLEQLAPESWAGILIEELAQLIRHPAMEVRLETLRRLLELRPQESAPLLRDRLEVEAERRVKAMLVRVLAVLQDADSESQILAAVRSPDMLMRAGGIVGLLSIPGGEHYADAQAALQRLCHSPDPQDRQAACEMLAELREYPAAADLKGLLQDQALAVRYAALRAARQHPVRDLIPSVLDACTDPATRRAAELVLLDYAAHDERLVLEVAGAVLSESPASGRVQSMVRVLGRIADPQAAGMLVPVLDAPDPDLRLQALLSLSRIGYRASSVADIFRRVREELDVASWLAAALKLPGALNGWGALREALHADYNDTRGRILLLLSFIYDARAVLLARNALGSTGSTASAMALETIDALLPSAAKPIILPLLEDITHAERSERWRAAGLNVPELQHDEVLRTLISSESSTSRATWTRMSAMYVAGLARVRSCGPALRSQSGLHGAHTALSQMQQWTVARLAASEGVTGDKTMLSLVEKVLILKSAPLFAETADSVLAEVAELVEETSFETDQVVFSKGDPGDSLYVIVSGSVKVWDGERLLNELGEGEAFGELALLDPEPRLGTVKAAEPTHLMRLDSASFRLVLDSQPEVSSAILRVVTKYLRTQLQFAREASARLRALESLTPIGPTGA